MEFATKMKVSFIVLSLCALYLFIYAFGKIFGFIHSPMWVNMSPILSTGITVITIIFTGGIVFQQILQNKKDIGKLEREMKGARKELRGMDKRLTTIEAKMDLVLQRLPSHN